MMRLQDRLLELIASPGRNKLVLCHELDDSLHFVNVGLELSRSINDSIESINHMDAVKSVLAQTRHDDTIGEYLALTNIGILFEPELKLNMRTLLDNYSLNQTLIIQSQYEVVNNVFYFIDSSSSAAIDLSGLAYFTL